LKEDYLRNVTVDNDQIQPDNDKEIPSLCSSGPWCSA
jgi:hypothetical protein